MFRRKRGEFLGDTIQDEDQRLGFFFFLKGPLFFFPWSIFTEIRGFIVTHFRQLCQYIGVEWSGEGVGGGNYCLHGLCGRREAEREGAVGGGLAEGQIQRVY